MNMAKYCAIIPPLELCDLPDSLLLGIFSFLPAQSLGSLACTCSRLKNITEDELLWKDLFYRHYKVHRSIPMRPCATFWHAEYKRLSYETPMVLCEELKKHKDQVLHISFSHNGQMFATTSKDGRIMVWNAGHPCKQRFSANMTKEFSWRYTQFSQFNKADTLLLVSGVYYGNSNTSGEIAVFDLQEFVPQCRVVNKPYDVFGTWYDNNHLLSGTLYWSGELNSISALWLNKASQELESERESVMMCLYRFQNINASSIRTIMVADCTTSDDVITQPAFSTYQCRKHIAPFLCPQCEQFVDHSVWTHSSQCTLAPSCPHCEQHLVCPHCKKQNFEAIEDMSTETRLKCDDSCSEFPDGNQNNSNASVNAGYLEGQSLDWGDLEPYKTRESFLLNTGHGMQHLNECQTFDCQKHDNIFLDNLLAYQSAERNLQVLEEYAPCCKKCSVNENSLHIHKCYNYNSHSEMPHPSEVCQAPECAASKACVGSEFYHRPSLAKSAHHDDPQLSFHSTKEQQDSVTPAKSSCCCKCQGAINSLKSNLVDMDKCAEVLLPSQTYPAVTCNLIGKNGKPEKNLPSSDKLLIFTMGEETYTPHLIGIKRMRLQEMLGDRGSQENLIGPDGEVRLLPDVNENLHGINRPNDTVDHVINMHGHIVGMALSPDHRYLYVNSRSWPQNYVIEKVLEPPPIAQEIDIHTIDLTTFQKVGKVLRSHRAYTPNDECFFLFLDISQYYVASGAEDNHGYLWDRHYGVFLNRFPHTNVVNSVAFNPQDQEMLVTVSDDFTIRVWRSRRRMKDLDLPTSAQENVQT